MVQLNFLNKPQFFGCSTTLRHSLPYSKPKKNFVHADLQHYLISTGYSILDNRKGTEDVKYKLAACFKN